MPDETTITSLRTYGQTVKSLLYPVGVEESSVTPGILTVVMPDSTNPRGRAVRYFSESKASATLRDLFVLEVVTAQAAVEGIEGEITMVPMLSEGDRLGMLSEATARLTKLDAVLSVLAEGSTYRTEIVGPRIEAERAALLRLAAAASQHYEPEPVRTQAEIDAEAETVMQNLVDSVRAIKVEIPK